MSVNQNAGSTFGLGSGGDAAIFANQLPDILGIVRERLQQAASSPDLFIQVFGNKANTSELQTVRSQWSVGDFSQLPSVQILSAGNTNGAFGAYASSTQTMYLSDALFQSSATPTNSVLGAAGVLVEETFHWLDDRVGTDTQGDEGELAKDLVFGVSLSASELTRIRAEDDRGFININGHLTAVEMAADYAGNTFGTARSISVGSSTSTFFDWVGSTDTNDYYRFTIGNTSNFNLNLNGLTSDADVQLLNSSGSLIQSSANGGTSAENIVRQLNAGTYYIRVLPYSGSTYYNLNLSATVIPPDYAGNTLSTARNVTLSSSTTTFQDWVGSGDTNDYYRFTVANTSNLNLSLNGMTSDADVQLLDANGNTIQSSANAGTSAESIVRQVNAGTYYIRVLPYSGSTYYNLNAAATTVVLPVPVDWFGQNLRDAGIVALTRSLASDGNLSRNDMISIFRNAEDGGTIDASELTDFRTILTNASRFGMADYVRVLSNKIANSDPANARSGFGNLFAGSSSTQMENLIGKWFLGTDRPDTGYTYQYTNGSLFQNGISNNDIHQGSLGDCYYLATLASIATDQPSYIQNMFIDNGDNTFTVRFYNSGVADYVTVDRYLPTTSWGTAVYAGWGGGSYTSSSNELWVALAEKAYAQMNESGWIYRWNNDHNNSYQAISGGNEYQVMNQVTALNSRMTTNVTQQEMINRVNSNNLVTFGINAAIFGSQYNGGHALAVTSYNASTGRFHLQNPWGSNHLDLTWNELQSWATTGWSYTL